LLAQLVDLGVDPWDGVHEHFNDQTFPGIPCVKPSTPTREKKQREHDSASAERQPGDDLQGGGHS
jgi:hypothetical protein